MKKIFGNFGGLKASQVRRIENLYRRRIPPQFIVTTEIALDISRLSREIGRQIGLLINRSGQIMFVIVGDRQKIVIPDTTDYRLAPGRLRGLRCIHTFQMNL
jgi:GTP-binding protein HflX